MNINNQKGMTFIGVLFVLFIIAFFVLIGLRIIPMYIESTKIRGSLQSLEKEPFITTKSKADIQKLIGKRFDIEDIESLDPRKDVEIKKERGILTISTKYELRKNILGNVDVIMSFDEKVEVVQN
jgi:hypothetical protein